MKERRDRNKEMERKEKSVRFLQDNTVMQTKTVYSGKLEKEYDQNQVFIS